MLRSERCERLEAWAAGTVLAPTLRDGPAGLLRVRWFLTQLSMKAAARLVVSVVLSEAKDLIAACNRYEILRCAQDDKKKDYFEPSAGGPKDVEIVDYHR
jgi:hypothetical protein